MAEVTTFDINPQGIAHMLSDRNWAVPRYQRAYKWEEKQVTDLFNDIENAIQEAQGEYFVGTIVVAKSAPDRPEIVDGQQRLATTTILIAAIRDYFTVDRNDAEGAEIIEKKYLFERDLQTRELQPRLQLSGADHDFFLRRILDAPSNSRDTVQPQRDSHTRIVLAQELAHKHVLKIVGQSSTPEDLLGQRLKYLSDHTRVILVEVPSHQNAFTIFETLNDRGITLAIADLLKNYLFHRAGNRIDEVQQRWIEMFSTIESAAGEETVKDFIRHQWSSNHGLTRERQLYDAIKKQIGTPKAAFEYVGELSKDAILYAALQNNSHEFWKGYGSATRHHVARIDDLGMERITPLLLAVLAVFTKTEVANALRMIVWWGVRILVAGAVAGALEIKYSEVACSIRKGTIKTAAKLFQAMKSQIPGNTEFEKAFAIAKVPRAATARYYLQVLEREAAGEAEPEFVPNPDESEINLEHVLPQNPKKGTWTNFDDEMRGAYTNRVGNLALFKRSENRGSGNDEFPDKKANLAASSYQLTSEIGTRPGWTVSEIEARQTRLAKLAVKAWPLK
jgi:uncharacterized protein DUF262/uncharacterized protein DUF1524